MRTVFIHGEVDLFSTAKEQLVERFTKWCAEEGAETPPFADLLLEDKFARDGLLTRWTEADLERFLTRVGPRRIIMAGSWAHVPRFLHLWLDFLHQSELLMNGPLADLHLAVDRATPAFLAAMAEPAEWSGEKFWSITMREHNVDVDDEQEIDRFFEAVAEGELVIDDSIADALEEQDASEPPEPFSFWLRPIADPDADTSGPDQDCPALGMMRALVDWVGDGRSLDEDGALDEDELGESEELSAALGTDQFGAELVLEWAKLVGLVRSLGNRLVPSQISVGLLEQPEVLWTRLWQNFTLLEEVFDADELGEEVVPQLIQDALNLLYSNRGAVPLEMITDLATFSVNEDAADFDEDEDSDDSDDSGDPADSEDEVRTSVGDILVRIFEQWESLGVVRQFRTEDPDEVAAIDAATGEDSPTDHTMIELLPSALPAVRGSLEAFGFTAPTSEDLVHYPAEVLALAVGPGPTDAPEPTAAAWIEHRGSATASAEFATLLCKVDDPTVRLAALSLLEHTGDDGTKAVHGLIDDPTAGSTARVWLQTRPSAPEVALRPDDELVFSLDTMSIAASTNAELFLDEFRQQSTPDQVAMVDQIPRVGHAHASEVLSAIAEGHPDERVAGAAQRSLGKVLGG